MFVIQIARSAIHMVESAHKKLREPFGGILRLISFWMTIAICSGTALADTQHIPIDTPPQQLPKSAEPYIQLKTGSIADPERAKDLLIETLLGKQASGKSISDFAIINVISFKDVDPKAQTQPQQVDKENWYVFRDKTIEKWSY